MSTYVEELKEKSVEQLQETLKELLEEQFKLNIMHSNDDLANTSRLKSVRRNIARVHTIINQKVDK